MCTCALVSVTITPALSPPQVPANTLSLAPVGVSHGPIPSTPPATSNATAILGMAPPSLPTRLRHQLRHDVRRGPARRLGSEIQHQPVRQHQRRRRLEI